MKDAHLTLASALLSSRNLTICWWPVPVQWNRAVQPLQSFRSNSAPCFGREKIWLETSSLTMFQTLDHWLWCCTWSRKYAMLSLPQLAASIKGVNPLAVAALTFTPASSRRFTMLSWPIYEAYISGVQPPMFLPSRFTSRLWQNASGGSAFHANVWGAIPTTVDTYFLIHSATTSYWPMEQAVCRSSGTSSSSGRIRESPSHTERLAPSCSDSLASSLSSDIFALFKDKTYEVNVTLQ